MKEKTKVNKYAKMQKALSEIVESVGSRKEERVALDIFIKESNKHKKEITSLGMSEVLQRDMNHRLFDAHSQGRSDMLVGTAVNYDVIMKAHKIW